MIQHVPVYSTSAFVNLNDQLHLINKREYHQPECSSAEILCIMALTPLMQMVFWLSIFKQLHSVHWPVTMIKKSKVTLRAVVRLLRLSSLSDIHPIKTFLTIVITLSELFTFHHTLTNSIFKNISFVCALPL